MYGDRVMYRFLKLEDQLPADAAAMGESVRSWVSDRFMPRVTGAYLKGEFPMELLSEMGRLGLFGIKTDPCYGGAGASNWCYGTACRELERGDSGLRSFVSVQNSLVMYPIEHFGSDAQKAHWLPLLAAGMEIGAFGLSESAGASDPEAMLTRAKRDGSDYVINGSKMWITNGSIADVIIVWAKLDGEVRGFLVPKGIPGLAAKKIEGKLSLRASITAALYFDDVRIPAENLLPGTMEKKKAYLHCLSEARFGIMWGALGAAVYCAEAAVEYAKGRTLFGGPLAGKQLIQHKIVRMDEMVLHSEMLAQHIAQLKEEGRHTPADISRGKMTNARNARDIAQIATDIFGGAGIVAESHVMRHLNNLQTVRTYEGTEDIHALIIGAEITGVKAL